MEDQTKYYISYPKPSVLDMKQQNRDINVMKEAQIPKFSKLDDMGILCRLFELFFDGALVDMIVGYTKLWNHREKADTCLEIINKTFRLLLDMPLLSGRQKLSHN